LRQERVSVGKMDGAQKIKGGVLCGGLFGTVGRRKKTDTNLYGNANLLKGLGEKLSGPSERGHVEGKLWFLKLWTGGI